MSNYLYNGYEHPELPDADEKEYPCVYLADIAGAGYLFFSTVPLKRRVSGIGLMAQTTLRGTEAGSVIAYVDTRTEEPFAWERNESYDSTFDADGMAVSSAMGKYIKWTNTDLYNEDGTLYLAASDPIPVGSAPEVEPKSFMAGWRMGQFIRGMRG